MNTKLIVGIAALLAIAVPVAVFANQPHEVRLAAFAPNTEVPAALDTLLIDPYAATELSITLPEDAADLDLGRDPFGAGPV